MKARLLLVVFLFSLLFSCKKAGFAPVQEFEAGGFSLYWTHQVFAQERRSLLFELYGNKMTFNQYEMHFKVSTNERMIEARLSDVIDGGQCPWFPMPAVHGTDASRCMPKGSFSIPEDQLTEGVYLFRVILNEVTLVGELTVLGDRYVLDLSDDTQLTSSIKAVYPYPGGW